MAYELYSLIRNSVPSRKGTAFSNAGRVMEVERALHLDMERTVNSIVAAVHWLSLTADWWYASLHFVVTLGVLVWLWRAHPFRYRAARSVLLVTNLVALVGFWVFPLAPPRLLAGADFVDTVTRDHIWGSFASAGMAAASNQFAAMPSMHIGWSLWCGIVVVTLARHRWLKVMGSVYPAITFAVIVGTANHYVVDALGGAAALASGLCAQRALTGRPALARPVRLPTPAPPARRTLQDAA